VDLPESRRSIKAMQGRFEIVSGAYTIELPLAATAHQNGDIGPLKSAIHSIVPQPVGS
jgi:hypothetical protein